MSIVFLVGVFLNLAGLALAIAGLFGGTAETDAWIKNNLPSPFFAIVIGVIVYVMAIPLDLAFFVLALIVDPSWLSWSKNPWFYYEGYLIAFFLAAYVVLAIPWLMARAQGGFFSSVAVLVSLGSCAMMAA